MAILYDKMAVLLQSPLYTIENMSESIKNTHRLLLKHIYANYESDIDLTFNLYFKRTYQNTEELLTYAVSKNNVYYKMKLPIGILCRECRFELVGVDSKATFIIDVGVLGKIHKIGAK